MEGGQGIAGPGERAPGLRVEPENMARSDSITMTFPPFSGMVRTLVLANTIVFLGFWFLLVLSPSAAGYMSRHFLLQPDSAFRGQIWQFFTYVFFESGLLGFVINNIFLWLLGSTLEATYGHRWFREFYFTAAIGGALLASLITLTGIFRLTPTLVGLGAGGPLFAILIVYGVRFGDLEFWLIPFPVRMKAKYMVALFIVIDLALLLRFGDPFAALLSLCGGFAGYLYLRFASSRGLGFKFSEQIFGMRNAWYRAKRRCAARKFEVYMGKQGRKVKFDDEGRYIDPDQERKDPNDKRWMN
jgi:membrane associated rhomboid family serine protease